jgi:hypothetical protein
VSKLEEIFYKEPEYIKIQNVLVSKSYYIKAYRRRGAKTHAFLTSALDRTDWSAFRPGRFAPISIR